MSPDFSRDVHCLLGLPFDAVDMAAAEARLRAAVTTGQRCFLSTPNLNFAIAAQNDPAFRDSVIRSDLNVADGMPLVWMARLLGIPLRERVAGSSLFERLRHESGDTPIRVYFFGGPDGVAAQAAERLNAQGGGLHCVGFDSPGFGSIEEMSSPERIERINASGADFVVVSLGAKKGQAWIEHNLRRLKAPVVSHLGAVVNFVAGTVKRSPGWMGRVGLEWLWRIREEPALWRRYANDGIDLLRLLVTHLLPLSLHVRFRSPSAAQRDSASVELAIDGAATVLALKGAWVSRDLAPIRLAFAQAAADVRPLRLDLRALTHIDSAVAGLLSLLWMHRRQVGRPWQLDGVHPNLSRYLRLACADYLLAPPAALLPVDPQGARAC